MDWDEITERLKNIENKINNQQQLNSDEALDIVFLPMFAPINRAKFMTEKLTILFSDDKSLTGLLEMILVLHYHSWLKSILTYQIKVRSY